jgi:hypothetical protein
MTTKSEEWEESDLSEKAYNDLVERYYMDMPDDYMLLIWDDASPVTSAMACEYYGA